MTAKFNKPISALRQRMLEETAAPVLSALVFTRTQSR